MFELVKWSFTLPIAAVLLSLTTRLVVGTCHSIFKTTVRAISADRDEKLFITRGHAEIGRLRPRSHVH